MVIRSTRIILLGQIAHTGGSLSLAGHRASFAFVIQ